MKYKFSGKEAEKIHKHGIDLTIYEGRTPTASVVRVTVKEGHFQEFYDTKSAYIYLILEGQGIFVLNDEMVQAESGDMIVIPAKTRIHYFGSMKMVLTVSPAFDPNNERHVRFVKKEESPFIKSSSKKA